jgi:probable rRNA maturation factor
MTTSGSSQPAEAHDSNGDNPEGMFAHSVGQSTGTSTGTPLGTPFGNVEVFVADEQDDITIDTDRWLRLAAQVLSAQGVTGKGTPDVEMSLYFVDETAISALNAQYMGKDGPTDVLSFPIDGEETVSQPAGRSPDASPRGPNDDRVDEMDDEQPMLLGDVLICPVVAQRNAAEHVGPHHDGSIDDELALLVVHGILHLLGMDHMVEAEAEMMEARERALLHQFHRPILDATDLLMDQGSEAAQ